MKLDIYWIHGEPFVSLAQAATLAECARGNQTQTQVGGQVHVGQNPGTPIGLSGAQIAARYVNQQSAAEGTTTNQGQSQHWSDNAPTC